MHPRVSRWHQRDFTTCPSQRTQVRLDMPSAALGQTHTGWAEGPQAVCSTQGGLAPAQEGRGGGAFSRIRGASRSPWLWRLRPLISSRAWASGSASRTLLLLLALGRKGGVGGLSGRCRETRVTPTARNKQRHPHGFQLVRTESRTYYCHKENKVGLWLSPWGPHTLGRHRWEVTRGRGPRNDSWQNQGARRNPRRPSSGGPVAPNPVPTGTGPTSWGSSLY